MNEDSNPKLELDDIQSGVLRPRPAPYVATYIALRIDERKAGRELMRRVARVVTSAANPTSPLADTWVSVALTYEGFKALGVPQEALDSFSWEFRQGMAARAQDLGDTGESAPENWERPLGTGDVHVIIVAVSPDEGRLEAVLEPARQAYRKMSGIEAIWRQNCHALPTETEPFGFRDGISHPAIEGSGIPGSNPKEQPLKAGEFVLGYTDEMNGVQKTVPEVLGRNGTYVVFRKLHQRVAEFRRYLKASANGPEDEELLAAKMMGRWRSGAPLALCPFHDDPALGADPRRNNDFNFEEDDAAGFKTPGGSHIRRTNPRDAKIAGLARIHRMLRRGTAYGPPLPEGVLEDDGAERGLMFAFVGAHLGRQFEFVQSQWINDGVFFGAGEDRDPITAAGGGPGALTAPRRPVRRRLQGIPQFVVTRGGEYCFMPGLRALRWLADLQT
ncbi:MAG TPA: Dyp-type peroxidase [Pyrinomonadaceae bacterium]|nr:Dyp-type peroxidase [Pyrinomonadaceae bacterium]